MKSDSWNTLLSLAMLHIPIMLGRATKKHTQGTLVFKKTNGKKKIIILILNIH